MSLRVLLYTKEPDAEDSELIWDGSADVFGGQLPGLQDLIVRGSHLLMVFSRRWHIGDVPTVAIYTTDLGEEDE